MTILLILLMLICMWKMEFSTYNDNYISKTSTDSIKGIFTIIILYSHLKSYLPGVHDSSIGISNYVFFLVINLIGQLMVVMFLFYSGYGILVSYRKKPNYHKHFLSNRVLKTLFTFDIAVILFILLALILQKDYTLQNYLLSLIGWENIGNSNWFVFDIIVLYLLCWITFQIISPAKLHYAVAGIFFLSAVFLLMLYFFKESSYWFDTIMAFPIGMVYALYREKIESHLRSNFKYTVILLICSFIFLILMKYGGVPGAILNSMVFPLIIVLVTVKVKIDNSALRWLGRQCFAVYIIQRIPMIIYSEMGLNDNWILFCIAVIPTTLLLAAIFTVFTDNINRRLFIK